VHADLIFRFAPRSRFQPYLIGVVGRLHSATTRSEPLGRSFDSEEDSFAFNLGLGALWHVARRWSIRPELRLVGSSSYEAITRYLRFSMGVGYYFF
jgi:hypothetical protein